MSKASTADSLDPPNTSAAAVASDQPPANSIKIVHIHAGD